MAGVLKNAFETVNGDTGASKTADAASMFTCMLLFALIVGVPVWYLFDIDFFKVLVVSLALATLYSLTGILDVGWFLMPLLAMMLGLIVAVPVWLMFGTGFFTVFAVSLVLGILIPFLEGEERREKKRREEIRIRYEHRLKKGRGDREQEERRQQEARLREAEQERLKREQEIKSHRAGRQGGGSGHTVPVRPHELRAMLYKEYLQTPHWKRRREDKLRAVGRRCQLCSRNSGTLDIHHNTYERLGEEQDGDLTVLCSACHNSFHEHSHLAR